MRILSVLTIFTLLAVAFHASPLLAEKKVISDDLLYDEVRRKLANDPDVKGGALDVEVHSGAVTLKGKVETERQRTKAERLAKKVKGVTSVTNQITLANK
jgi:osmotically-inducible protein OsmY